MKKNAIYRNIEAYLKAYYLRESLKGVVLFLFFSVSFFLFLVFLEWILWIPSDYKSVLIYFYGFSLLLFFLLFIALPVIRYLGYFRNLSPLDVARDLSRKIPSLQDKLLNYLELEQLSGYPRELLQAELKRREKILSVYNLRKNIRFRDYFSYFYLLLIPLLILDYIRISGQVNDFEGSYQRVVAFNRDFQKPAPFQIKILNDLHVKPDTTFTLQVVVNGEKIPDELYIRFFDRQVPMLKKNDTTFVWLFDKINKDIPFRIQTNKYSFGPYKIQLLHYPAIEQFVFHLKYPAYVKFKGDTLLSQTFLKVPYGTKLHLDLYSKNTDTILSTYQGYQKSVKQDSVFSFDLNAKQTFNETFLLLNQKDGLTYHFTYNVEVIPDEKPSINVIKKSDTSLFKKRDILYITSEDDYGLTSLYLFYQSRADSSYQTLLINKLNNKVSFNHAYIFPDDFHLPDTVSYTYFFRIYDNNAVDGYNFTDSPVFEFTPKKTQKDPSLIHEKSIDIFSKTFSKSQENENKLSETIQKLRSEKQIGWQAYNNLQSLLKNQQEQDRKMQELIKEMEEISKKFTRQSHDSLKAAQIKKRLDEIKKMYENQKREQELNKLLNELKKDKLLDKLQELKNQNAYKNQSVSRTLELIKRFYVEEQLKNLSQKLNQLSAQQQKLARQSGNNELKQQNELNRQTDSLAKNFHKIDSLNRTLQKPMQIPLLKPFFKAVRTFQKESVRQLQQNQPFQANPSQQKAAGKMQEMNRMLESFMQSSQSQQQQEDLNQIKSLINTLLNVSFQEESLLSANPAIPHQYTAIVLQQNRLNTVLQKVSDTLQAIGMRQPALGQEIFDALYQAGHSGTKSLEHLQEREFSLAKMRQHMMFEHVNKLIYYLNLFLDARLRMGMAKGQGKGGKPSESPMPDLIKKRSQKIGQSMQKALQRKGKRQQGDGDPSSVYQLYKEQQQLKDLLNKFSQKYPSRKIQELNEELEKLSGKLLRQGLTPDIYQKYMSLQYELLKLVQATYKQHTDNQRESTPSEQRFNVPDSVRLQLIEKYFPQVEYLKYSNIPLRKPYKDAYKQYKKQLQ